MREPIQLDFQPAPLSLHWSGLALLAAGLATVLIVGVSHLALRDELGTASQRLDAAERQLRRQAPPPRVTAPNPARAEQTREANEVMGLLGLPWQGVLAELEHVQSPEVGLLGIEPDLEKGVVRLSGEAHHYESVLVYMKALQKNTSLTEVVLQTHSIETQKPGTPVHFLLTARWSPAQ